MKISFHGAARTVTGSKHLLTLSDGRRILLDCGMFQGMGKETDAMNRHWGFDPREVDVMVLSHAHIDHSGLIPKLVSDGYKGKIHCTPATRDLATVLLEDSAGIQEDDIKYANKIRVSRGQPPLKPLYTEADARAAAERFHVVDYGGWFPISEGVDLMFTDAGHIIGSAAVHLRINDQGRKRQLTFSGDVGRYRDMILKSPETFPQSDYVILESTYGNSLHDLHTPTVDILLEWIEKTCLHKKGKLIIPAFSVGRTQEILYSLNQLDIERRLPDLDYFVDSPLSIKATEIVKKYPAYFNATIRKVLEKDNDPFGFPGLKYIRTVDESKLLNFRPDPCVIISASGMAEAGRVKHHINNTVENSRNSILMTGYCEPHSLGARLLSGRKEVGIYGVQREVHAEVGSIRSMSAHGDYEDLSQFLACQDPRQIRKLFLVHGEYDVQEDFRQRLVHKGFTDVTIPEMHYSVGLD
ncbi:MAG: MBL fold metallo-hydrolase [Chitinophagia bacterium]|nr:MBL fold metallo-hydrolase [Chitinophagia bacterium]